MMDEIKIEDGPNREFSTGAEKQAATGKGTPVLVPGDVIIDIAKHFEKGAEVYGARNWEKGIPLSELLNSLERHLQQEKMGLTDEPHARALAWNALVYLATKLRIEKGLLPAELDDMPKYTKVVEQDEDCACKSTCEKCSLEEVMEINDELAEEFKDKLVEELTMEEVAAKGPAEDEEKSPYSVRPDGKLYCKEWDCYKRGFQKKGSKEYRCPEHQEKGN